ncbi:hypothetical protein QZH41_006973 [Actinostola sp. cb2023]|nr:hypothetical protein QZH41_006973 [Actinostola sp. cb2023]
MLKPNTIVVYIGCSKWFQRGTNSSRFILVRIKASSNSILTFYHGAFGYGVFSGEISRSNRFRLTSEPEVAKALQAALEPPPPRFPPAFSLAPKVVYPIPAAEWATTPANLPHLLREQQIPIEPGDTFTWKPRDFFLETRNVFYKAKVARAWLEGSNMHYWPQQLNFAVWEATAGCGIGYDILAPEGVVAALLRFHTIFTIRCILTEQGDPLPGDTPFSKTDNPYSKPVYKRLCGEFGID